MANVVPSSIDPTLQPAAPAADTGIPEFESRAALESVRAEMAALRDEELAHINVVIADAARLVRGYLPRMMAERARIASELPSFDLSKLDRLETYALAAFWANVRYMSAFAPSEPTAPIIEDLTEVRDLLMSDAFALAKRGIVDVSRLQSLRGRGPVAHKDLASEVGALVNFFREGWAQVQGRTPVTVAELDRAEAQANRLERLLALRDFGPKDIAEVTATRDRAYTLFVTAYDEVRRALSFLHWKTGRLDEIAPSLAQSRRLKRQEAETADTVDLPRPQAPAAPAATPQPPAAPFAPPGMPGNEPLVR